MNCSLFRPFVVPLDEAKVGTIYHLLLCITREIDCLALAYEGFFSEKTRLSIIDRLSEKNIYGGEFVEELIATIPEDRYIPPCEYEERHLHLHAYALSADMAVARQLNKSTVWLLAAALFSDFSAWLFPAGITECTLDDIILEVAFMIGFGEVFLEQLVSRQRCVDFAMIPFVASKKTETACMVLWGGNADVVAKLSVACKRVGVNARDTIDF